MNTHRTIIFIALLLFLNSCGFHYAPTSNNHDTVTNVKLSENNFKIIKKVEAKASAGYFFGFGGLQAKSLVGTAKSKLYEKSNLTEGPRALINVTVDHHESVILIYVGRTVTVSGYVIEFTD